MTPRFSIVLSEYVSTSSPNAFISDLDILIPSVPVSPFSPFAPITTPRFVLWPLVYVKISSPALLISDFDIPIPFVPLTPTTLSRLTFFPSENVSISCPLSFILAVVIPTPSFPGTPSAPSFPSTPFVPLSPSLPTALPRFNTVPSVSVMSISPLSENDTVCIPVPLFSAAAVRADDHSLFDPEYPFSTAMSYADFPEREASHSCTVPS